MPGYEDRTFILQGAGAMIFNIVCDRSTPEQWAAWRRVPLEHAAGTANVNLVDKLLKAGANGSADWKGCNGQSLLHAAAGGGNEQVVSAYVRAGAKEDMHTKAQSKGRTTLYLAAVGGDVAATKATAGGRLRLAVEINDTAEAIGQRQGGPSRRARRGEVKVEVTMGGALGGGAAGSGRSTGGGGGRSAARGGSSGGGFDGVAACSWHQGRRTCSARSWDSCSASEDFKKPASRMSVVV
eukprot:g10829.t1